MALFASPRVHAENPPATWVVVKKMAGRWALCTKAGTELQRFTSRRDAESAREGGQMVELYRKEGRWFAGESVQGWEPYVPR